MPGGVSARPRLAPGVPLPPYSFIPGSSLPHPTADPAGHSFGKRGLPVDAPPDPQNWAACTPYLFAIDLFNHGYYWEAHEAWEALWQACGRHGLIADFFKALIKLAATGVKVREGQPAGVRSHGRRAAELFEQVAKAIGPGQTHFLGLELGELAQFGHALSAAPPVCLENGTGVAVVLDRALLPANA
jgi:uncharacterized protein